MGYWKKIQTKVLLEHPRVLVVEDDVLLPDGHQTQYLRYENLADYATVIAERDGKIAFVKEYSYPLDTFLLQFPEGSFEQEEGVTEAAKRELAEEAALQAQTYSIIGKSPAHHRRETAFQYVLLAQDVSETERKQGDAEEQGIETVWIDKKEVMQKIAGGEIVQKNALAAWSLYLAATA